MLYIIGVIASILMILDFYFTPTLTSSLLEAFLELHSHGGATPLDFLDGASDSSFASNASSIISISSCPYLNQHNWKYHVLMLQHTTIMFHSLREQVIIISLLRSLKNSLPSGQPQWRASFGILCINISTPDIINRTRLVNV